MPNNVMISNPQIEVNNIVVSILPNTIMYREGLGEQMMHVITAGGNNVQTVFAQNVETNLGFVKFSLRSTTNVMDLVREWKTNGNSNVVTISEVGFTRTFKLAALLNDYDVNLTPDGSIDVEFTSLQAS